jgi:hypothetical protein
MTSYVYGKHANNTILSGQNATDGQRNTATDVYAEYGRGFTQSGTDASTLSLSLSSQTSGSTVRAKTEFRDLFEFGS